MSKRKQFQSRLFQEIGSRDDFIVPNTQKGYSVYAEKNGQNISL
jgi:hypothetical protein